MVRTRFLNASLLAALVFALSRLWLFLGEPPPGLPAIAGGPTSPAAAVATEPKAEVTEFRPESYDVIVARDLFSQTRGVVPPAPAAAAMPAPKPQPAPKLTLYGVVVIDGQKTAYLQEGAQEGRPRKVLENESFAGGMVKTIRPDGLTFLFAGTEINVPLRTPKDATGAPSPRAQAAGNIPSRPETPVAIPRRQTPPGIQPGQMPAGAQPGQIPAPGRPAPAVPGIPMGAPQVEPGSEVFPDEEFPEGPQPGGEMPGMTEEEVGE
jgi:hypothetical protein